MQRKIRLPEADGYIYFFPKGKSFIQAKNGI